jgi:metallophosphoesterase superfamily enzyme
MVIKRVKIFDYNKGTKMRYIEDQIIKNLVISDIHIPYQDDRAITSMFKYAKMYNPNNIIINGDLLDFYGLSKFDKSPDRKITVAEEVVQARKWLGLLRRRFQNADIYLLQGNHENRLQKYMWRNPELHGLSELKLENLLEFKKHKIKEVQVDGDYWSTDTGHLKIGDAVIMHGDSRLNGATLSKYSGYSSSNTMRSTGSSTIVGHNHRMAIVKHRTPYQEMTGIETGCLCIVPGNSNWQQGFVTFETFKDKNYNYRLHHIQDGKLIENGKIYQ